MTKEECIEYETKEYHRKIEGIQSLPEIDGFECRCGIFDKAYISCDVDSLDLMYKKLHDVKNELGDYKIINYWIPYDGCVAAEYKFGDHTVKFFIRDNDEQKIIDVLSNGKCKIEQEVSKKVVCRIGA